MAHDVLEAAEAVLPFTPHALRSAGTEPIRMRDRVTADHVAACIEVADLSRAEEALTVDVVGRNETVRSPAARLEAVCHNRVVRHAAVVYGDEERSSAFGLRSPVCACPPKGGHFVRTGGSDVRSARLQPGQAVKLRIEFSDGQLVSI